MRGASSLTDGEIEALWSAGYSAGEMWRRLGGERLTRAGIAACDLSNYRLIIRDEAVRCGATWWPRDADQPDASVADAVWAVVRIGFAAALEHQDWIAP